MMPPFITRDGLRLYEYGWLPDTPPRGVVALVHGYAEHAGRYAHVAAHLNANGFGVYAFDLRGHGRSEGKRAFVSSFEQYVRDVSQFIHRVRREYPDGPLFLLGHSMGGLASALYTLGHAASLEGLILSSPAVRLKVAPGWLLHALTTVLSSVAPALPTLKLDSRAMSRDPNVVRSYDSDPLNYRGGTRSRTAHELLRATHELRRRMAGLSLPLLVFHGTSDPLVDVEGSKRLYEAAAASDKTLHLYEGLYHETFNEPEQQQVLADVTAWLDERAR